jgi:hypothetical protein
MQMFGGNAYSTDPANKAAETINKQAASFVGGFIPRIFKDIETWQDSKVYKPEDMWAEWVAQVPVYRRSAGAPLRDIFYEPVQITRTAWRRAVSESPNDDSYRLLGKLNSRGVFLPAANPDNRKILAGKQAREMTVDESQKYMEEVGTKYREMIDKYGEKLLQMPQPEAQAFVSKATERIRDMAFKKVAKQRLLVLHFGQTIFLILLIGR